MNGDWGTLAVLVTLALYPCRSAVEMAIEKSETTAMQWLKKQTQNNC
jgi:hypothetical protein